LLFTVTFTALLEISVSSKSRNLLQFSVKEKGGKTDRKPYRTPFSMVSEIRTETTSLGTLKIMPRNLNVIEAYP
jgi:hypothetical protein